MPTCLRARVHAPPPPPPRSASAKAGYAIHVYACTRSMEDACLANADGDLLIMPQHGGADGARGSRWGGSCAGLLAGSILTSVTSRPASHGACVPLVDLPPLLLLPLLPPFPFPACLRPLQAACA